MWDPTVLLKIRTIIAYTVLAAVSRECALYGGCLALGL